MDGVRSLYTRAATILPLLDELGAQDLLLATGSVLLLEYSDRNTGNIAWKNLQSIIEMKKQNEKNELKYHNITDKIIKHTRSHQQ